MPSRSGIATIENPIITSPKTVRDLCKRIICNGVVQLDWNAKFINRARIAIVACVADATLSAPRHCDSSKQAKTSYSNCLWLIAVMVRGEFSEINPHDDWNPEMSKLAVFVDVQNIYYTTRDAFGRQFNYREFWRRLETMGEMIRAIRVR
jgi:hypothetical protein